MNSIGDTKSFFFNTFVIGRMDGKIEIDKELLADGKPIQKIRICYYEKNYL